MPSYVKFFLLAVLVVLGPFLAAGAYWWSIGIWASAPFSGWLINELSNLLPSWAFLLIDSAILLTIVASIVFIIFLPLVATLLALSEKKITTAIVFLFFQMELKLFCFIPTVICSASPVGWYELALLVAETSGFAFAFLLAVRSRKRLSRGLLHENGED